MPLFGGHKKDIVPLSAEKWNELTIYDFHSHILPGMDDGSRNTEESLAMLKESAKQGVSVMVASPHFYPEEEYPKEFLKRREEAAKRLIEGMKGISDDVPEVFLGAEVAYFPGMGNSAEMKNMCISGTKYILVEMPFSKWNREIMSDVIGLKRNMDLRPIIAHIGRYSRYADKSMIGMLLDNDILIQSNAEFFTDSHEKKKAVKMLNEGQIHLLGSDCHNMGRRRPDLGDAMKIIASECGAVPFERMEVLGREILKNAIRL